jgi:hypothetical protein
MQIHSASQHLLGRPTILPALHCLEPMIFCNQDSFKRQTVPDPLTEHPMSGLHYYTRPGFQFAIENQTRLAGLPTLVNPELHVQS